MNLGKCHLGCGKAATEVVTVGYMDYAMCKGCKKVYEKQRNTLSAVAESVRKR